MVEGKSYAKLSTKVCELHNEKTFGRPKVFPSDLIFISIKYFILSRIRSTLSKSIEPFSRLKCRCKVRSQLTKRPASVGRKSPWPLGRSWFLVQLHWFSYTVQSEIFVCTLSFLVANKLGFSEWFRNRFGLPFYWQRPWYLFVGPMLASLLPRSAKRKYAKFIKKRKSLILYFATFQWLHSAFVQEQKFFIW